MNAATKVDSIVFQDSRLVPIWGKVLSSERLDRNDGLTLLESWDLTAVGKMADHVKRSKSDELVYLLMRLSVVVVISYPFRFIVTARNPFGV